MIMIIVCGSLNQFEDKKKQFPLNNKHFKDAGEVVDPGANIKSCNR